MKNKNARNASKLAKIAGILYLIGAVVMTVISMVKPVEIKINDSITHAYLWEFSTYPGPLSLLLGLIAVPTLLGVMGLVFSKRVKEKATTVQGVFMLVTGIMSIITGVGILFIIAGIQTLLAKKTRELLAREVDDVS